MILRQRVYVDLDCLHDTRYGLLLDKYPWCLSKLDYERYSNRITDSWVVNCGIAMEDWIKNWASRDISVLKQSPPSVFLYALQQELNEKNTAVKLGAPLIPPELTVNVYPYNLGADERKVYMSLLDKFYGEVTEDIAIISSSPEQLTVEMVKDNFESAFMYNWREWLGLHLESLGNNPMPSFVLNGPALLDIKSVNEVVNDVISDKVNPFTETKDFLAEFLTLDLLNSSLFSLRLPKSKSSSPNRQK